MIVEDVSTREDSERIRRERDLYRQLLDLGRSDEIQPFIKEALSLIVSVAGARRGYLELKDPRGGEPFWIAHDCSDAEVELIRGAFSRGVIAQALSTGDTIITASALVDPRFRELQSVKDHKIEAVLCTPVGAAPPLGVLYLQDRILPGPFTREDRDLCETCARTIAVFADRLLIRRRAREENDPTLPFRKALQAAGIVGRSPALARLLKQVAVAAPLDVGVLLTGPSGTGKTRIARLIHDNSARASGPFVELNCAALSESLVESELFGAHAGAHSTATRKVDGKVAAAEHGTLFLDEIAEVALPAQAKLLQLLESKRYYPLGSNKPVFADVRIIAATNADLAAAVRGRTFRQDLYYRLDVMPIAVPSLAERRADVPLLVSYFCQRTVEAHNLPCLEPSEGLLRAAEAAEWPGNIRQLVNAVQRAAFTAASEEVLRVERRHMFPDHDDDSAGEPLAAAPLTFQDATRAFQAELLRRTLDETQWNVTETATRLDLARSHVYNLIKAFGLSRRHD
ncbi:MAG: sigma-54-dependent Fis family transcriptional regulator [Minicystis sp.]